MMATPTPQLQANMSPMSADAINITGRPVRIMALGDSITMGAGGSSSLGGYRGWLQNSLNAATCSYDFVGSQIYYSSGLADKNHEGYAGYTIDKLKLVTNYEISAFWPDVVLLHAGTNDLLATRDCSWGTTPCGMPYSQVRADISLTQLISNIFAIKPDTAVYVAKIIPMRSPAYNSTAVVTYNSYIPGIVSQFAAQGRRIYTVDQYNALLPYVNDTYYSDSAHPTDAGYQIMANAWYAAKAYSCFSDPTQQSQVTTGSYSLFMSDLPVMGTTSYTETPSIFIPQECYHNGNGPFERDMNNGGILARDGGPIRVDGNIYTKGLGVYPFNGTPPYSAVCFDLKQYPNCTAFASDIGVDDAITSTGSVTFRSIWMVTLLAAARS